MYKKMSLLFVLIFCIQFQLFSFGVLFPFGIYTDNWWESGEYRCVKEQKYSPYGAEKPDYQEWSYYSNPRGKIALNTSYYTILDSKYFRTTVSEYFSEGKLKREYTEYSSGKTASCTYEYNDQDLLYQEKHYKFSAKDTDVGLIATVTYEYDEMGNKIKEISVTEDEERIRTYEYVFDDAGKAVETIVFSDGALLQRWVYEYDSNDNVIAEIRYKADGTESMRYVAEYNDQLLYKVEYYSGGKLKGYSIYTWKHLDEL